MPGTAELIIAIVLLQLVIGFIAYRTGLRIGKAEGELRARAQR